MKNPKRGEIWFIDWSPGRGSEQTGTRPAVILQTDLANLNENYPNSIVLALSTKGKNISFHIKITPSVENGLNEISFVKCEQIMTISKERLIKCIGKLEEQYITNIEKAVKKVLEFI